MSLIAEFDLANPILRETRRAMPDLEFEVEDEFVSPDGTRMLAAWAMGDRDALARLDRRLPDDPTVTGARLLADLDEKRLYRVELTTAAEPGMTYPVAVEHGITFLEVRASGDRVSYRAQVPNREALVAYRRYCEERDLGFRLTGLFRGGSTESTVPALTDRQREVLRAAYRAGYFEVPRRTTLEGLADELDVSDQALSAILRRAQANLLAETVADDIDDAAPAESDGS
ncbi:helix-turn-helix domain-containing protein [Halovivax sp.]|uniref:helix-turn-helix domain-containing protein n=1 Tax=Halovivax sp. TaxID=1935978 RepID=UPI0025C50FBD|nr:helix-turn-helix domain-containing protein [Halovivax sp.]